MDRKDRHIPLIRMYDAIVGDKQEMQLESAAVAHFEACGDCQGNKEWLTAFLQFGAADAMNEPPAWSVVNTIKAFTLKKSSAFRSAKEFIATLIYDSFTEPLPAGVRQRDLDGRQTLYRVEGLQVDLKLQITEQDKGMIIGQVVSESMELTVSDLPIALNLEGELVGIESTNASGEFMFDDLRRGQYELEVQLGENTLRIPKISLG